MQRIFCSLVALAVLVGGTVESRPPINAEQTAKPLDEITNSIGMKLVYIPPGSFIMGSTKEVIAAVTKANGNRGYDAEGPQHEVEITGFYMGVYEVTIGQFKHFVAAAGYRTEAEKDRKGGHGYNKAINNFQQKPEFTWKNSGWAATDNHPVVNVTWNDAKAFCAWLSKRENKTYGLPSEAQWEYACRAGTATAFYSGDDPETLAQVGNVPDGTAKAKFPEWTLTIKAADGYVFTAPVGQFRKNAFGLFDMHGNVGEWCEDTYDPKYYEKSPKRDPLNTAPGNLIVIRGGAWGLDVGDCRSARRNCHVRGWWDLDFGFRVVLSPR